MQSITRIRGRVMPLARDDVDTDQIMPKQFLTRVEREGFGEFVFHEWRGDPGFVFNDPRFAGARILAAGRNFGSGSSREHAVWGLQQYGFDAVLAPSFSDIFAGNCVQAGVVPAVVDDRLVQAIQAAAEEDPASEIDLDLRSMTLWWPGGEARFGLEEQARDVLLNGLDDVTLILSELTRVERHEQTRPSWMPHVSK